MITARKQARAHEHNGVCGPPRFPPPPASRANHIPVARCKGNEKKFPEQILCAAIV